jgi:hypothetical protein
MSQAAGTGLKGTGARSRGRSRVDLLQKIEELDGTMPAIAFFEHVACGDIQSGKQTGDTVAFVIVGAALQLSGPHGQHRLGAAQCLNLLFSSTQSTRA